MRLLRVILPTLFPCWDAPYRAGLEVRALLPDATEVWVIEPKTGRKVGNLECLDSRGFFRA
jgi:hypothetical protein